MRRGRPAIRDIYVQPNKPNVGSGAGSRPRVTSPGERIARGNRDPAKPSLTLTAAEMARPVL